jgi:hypothetical protein
MPVWFIPWHPYLEEPSFLVPIFLCYFALFFSLKCLSSSEIIHFTRLLPIEHKLYKDREIAHCCIIRIKTMPGTKYTFNKCLLTEEIHYKKTLLCGLSWRFSNKFYLAVSVPLSSHQGTETHFNFFIWVMCTQFLSFLNRFFTVGKMSEFTYRNVLLYLHYILI